MYTYKQLMNYLKDKLPDDMDTGEGTVAHVMMSVTALAGAQLYESMEEMKNNCYALEAEGKYLDKVVALLGMTRKDKTHAVVKVKSDESFAIGTKFTGGNAEYEIISLEPGYYTAKCLTAGSEGNAYLGEIVPIEDSAAGNAYITQIIVEGADVESDEDLRARYKERLLVPIVTGNRTYYREMIHSVPNTGGIKIFSAAEGGGVIRAIITNSDYKVADEELINYVQEYLDPIEQSGMGLGVLPIGHSVRVESAESVDFNLEVEINGGVNQAGYLRTARSGLKIMLWLMNKEWEDKDNLIIRVGDIEDYFLSLNGVESVKVISMNGETSRLVLAENQIIGEVTVNGS